jgi:hypothetical protein
MRLIAKTLTSMPRSIATVATATERTSPYEVNRTPAARNDAPRRGGTPCDKCPSARTGSAASALSSIACTRMKSSIAVTCAGGLSARL